jgi:glyoxylase-like metal-dependent hydrolase (beta-lactamase superfamily II)
MAEQIPLESPGVATSAGDMDRSEEVAPDLSYKKTAIANVAFYGRPGEAGWVLIDAGMPGSAEAIYRAAAERFGENVPPSAIVLTHGHFDHVGALPELAAEWQTPIYAHWQEHPFLTGARAYPPPPKGTGGVGMGQLWGQGRLKPVNVSRWLGLLSGNAGVPFMPGWRVIPTPGHSPGHVSLWREADRTLIAGDAVISTRQECAYATLTQKPELQGPPRHYTQEWDAARDSARRLAALEPELLLTGHGPALRGAEMREALKFLAEDFDQIARPGRIRT